MKCLCRCQLAFSASCGLSAPRLCIPLLAYFPASYPSNSKLKQTLSSISCLWSSYFCHGHRKLTKKASDAMEWTRARNCPLVPYLEGLGETWGQWMRKVIKFWKHSLKVFLSRVLLDSISWRNMDYKCSEGEVSNKNTRNRTRGH